MNIEEYKAIRLAGKELVLKILSFNVNGESDVLYATKRLDFKRDNSSVIDPTLNHDSLFDYLIFEKNKKGKRLIDKFYDSDVELSEMEEDYLEGQKNFIASLFEVTAVDPDAHTVTVTDIFNKGSQSYQFMDIGLSQTIPLNVLIYTRLLPIADTYLLSGVSFLFDSEHKEKALSDISFARFRKRSFLDSSDLFTLFYNKYQVYGLR